MKTLKTILWTPVMLLVIGMLLALLFYMPVDFGVSVYQLVKLDNECQGTVKSVEVVGSDDTRKTVVTYHYQVNGEFYQSQRMGPGLQENLTESDGEDIAEDFQNNQTVTVYYDTDDPQFSVLKYGIGHWAIGFSMAVWGMLISNAMLTHKKTKLFGFYRGLVFCGFISIIICPQFICREHIVPFFSAAFIVILLSIAHALWKKPKEYNEEEYEENK
jgi:hypothetical protein